MGTLNVHNYDTIQYDSVYLTCSKKLIEQRTIIQQYGDGTLAVDGWAVTFGTARRGLGGLRPRPVTSSLYQM